MMKFSMRLSYNSYWQYHVSRLAFEDKGACTRLEKEMNINVEKANLDQ